MKKKRRRIKLPESDSSEDEGGYCYNFLLRGSIYTMLKELKKLFIMGHNESSNPSTKRI